MVPAAQPRRTVGAGTGTSDGIDWALVAATRKEVSNQLSEQLKDGLLDLPAQQELGRAIILDLIRAATTADLLTGQDVLTPASQTALAAAVYDATFALGRFQPLVDDPTVEDIHALGADDVWVRRGDGSLEQVDPVAESDAELTEFLGFLASKYGRAFSESVPKLDLRLEGRARLSAFGWVCARPLVTIRCHSMVNATLSDLVALDTVTPLQASFLTAAVRMKKNIVVDGAMGAGKTTLARALARLIPPGEVIGTFETEAELFLEDFPYPRALVKALESRPGSGEIGPDGRPAGEVTLDSLQYTAFRHALTRIIIGEVRGPEVWAMIKAMEAGAGGLCTVHATSAAGALRRLVSCAMEAGSHFSRDLATAKLAEAIDLIVHVEQYRDNEGSHRRRVSQIVAISSSFDSITGYSADPIFDLDASGHATPKLLPDDLRDLANAGFDMPEFDRQAEARSTW